MEYYAKSSPPESIKQHTDELLNRLEEFQRLYGKWLPLTARDWQLLRLAVLYHDAGKADIVFQNRIRGILGLNLLPEASSYQIPHNILSVMAIPFRLLDLNKDEQVLLAQLVAYHHERGILPDKEEIKANYKGNIVPYKKELEEHLGIAIDEKTAVSKISKIEVPKRFYPSHPSYHRYILLKGILHRLDHAASAHVPIELATEMDVSQHVNDFFANKLKKEKKPLQVFAEEHREEHLVIVAQTGMGKTEAGLLWLGNKKGFFTLPLRVSINAMYSRVSSEDQIGFSKKGREGEEAIGLLHSTSLDYLYDQEGGREDELEKMHSQTKQYANKLIISTIDQILKFPLYYLGFEKEYALMATSKVIVDELQAYDPKIAAVLIRAMKLIDEIGGSFMIMTATLPGFYYNALQRELFHSKKQLTYAEFIDDSIIRHHVLTAAKSISDEEILEEIKGNGESKKVLVICNTVRRAQEVYEGLREKGCKTFLLHSRFIKQDRSRLETDILAFAKGQAAGVWVTTQLVEASLDIDFDMLYTEMSSLDSQFQRYGRCNRKGLKSVAEPNVIVLTEDVSGVLRKGKVYHKDIYNRSLILLSDCQEGVLLESEKQRMIKELYDEESLKNSGFLKEFEEAMVDLKEQSHYDPQLKKRVAQEILRDIQQIQAVPIDFQQNEHFQEALCEWKAASSKQEKRRARMVIEAFSVGVPMKTAERIGYSPLENIKGLFYIHCSYSNELGLLTDKETLFS
ncbi:CRISPR-associated helicase/endonuclease Cas3 [Bacillus massilinigeriensis]|uniref:CRISPR-associated helicase/endonuclease Cas3 n=1 Tax=Bacillus mediterraneensis TaxID=1805474 RepID=UPI0008F8B111|nr:CRISPR-associated helicase/endonuclease Cas3 [Bacillus mediterraneensis]